MGHSMTDRGKHQSTCKKASFLIEFIRQDYYSWQGRVVWLEKNESQYFRSALELIRMIGGIIEPDDMRSFDDHSDAKELPIRCICSEA